MQRPLFLLALGLGLLFAGSASALVMTGGSQALLRHAGPPDQSLALHLSSPTTPLISVLGPQLVPNSIRRSYEPPGFARWRNRAPETRRRDAVAKFFPRFARARLELPMLDGPLLRAGRQIELDSGRENVVTPEPGTAMLFGAGMLGMGLWRRRQR